LISIRLISLYIKKNFPNFFFRNLDGFRKVSNIENSGLRSERDDIEFYNQYFIKGQEYALERIKRKVTSLQSFASLAFLKHVLMTIIVLTYLKISPQIPSVKGGPNSVALKHEDVSEILTDVETIRGRQDSVDSLLTNMQRENEALWREVAILRQKHHKQQQIVEKLIQFLVSLVHNRGLLGIKRKAQLMIDDSEENSLSRSKKISKTNECDFTSGSRGPIIHDVTDDFDENVINASCNSPIITTGLNIGEMSPNPQVLMPDTNNSEILSPKNDLLTNSSEPIETLHILDPLQESIKELGLVADEQNENEPNVEDTLSVDSLLRSSLNTPPGSPSNNFDNQSTNTTENNNNVKDLVVSTQNDDQRLKSLNPK
jgi:heat shock transcription factor 1